MGLTDALDVDGRGVRVAQQWAGGDGGLLTSARLLEGVASPWPWQGCTEGHSKAREGDVRPLHNMGWWPRGCQEWGGPSPGW